MKKIITTLLSASFLLPAIAFGSCLHPSLGGTGTCAVPSVGQILVATTTNLYAPVDPSSLGIYSTFATSTTGSDFTITTSGATATFNLPTASATARGVVSTSSQTFGGTKTFSDIISTNSTTTNLNIGAKLSLNGTYGSNLQSLLSRGTSSTPIWGTPVFTCASGYQILVSNSGYCTGYDDLTFDGTFLRFNVSQTPGNDFNVLGQNDGNLLYTNSSQDAVGIGTDQPINVGAYKFTTYDAISPVDTSINRYSAVFYAQNDYGNINKSSSGDGITNYLDSYSDYQPSGVVSADHSGTPPQAYFVAHKQHLGINGLSLGDDTNGDSPTFNGIGSQTQVDGTFTFQQNTSLNGEAFNLYGDYINVMPNFNNLGTIAISKSLFGSFRNLEPGTCTDCDMTGNYTRVLGDGQNVIGNKVYVSSNGYNVTGTEITSQGSYGTNSNVGLTVSANAAIYGSNVGIKITGPSASSTNYAIDSTATAKSYLGGQLGIGTSTPGGSLAVQALSTTESPLIVASSTGATYFEVQNNTHIKTASSTTSTVPSISSCGTSPSIVGTDHKGYITVGTGGVTSSCLLTFKKAYNITPVCFAQTNSTSTPVAVLSTLTNSVTFGFTNAYSGNRFNYICEE